MKNLKKIILLGMMLVNLMPYIKDGKIELKSAEVKAQDYITEPIAPGPIPTLDICYDVDNTMRWGGASLYNSITKNYCGILVLSSITGAAVDSVFLDYLSFANITADEFDGTSNETDFYARKLWGVTIGVEIPKTKCGFLTALHKAGNSTGVFVEETDHVAVMHYIRYENNGFEDSEIWIYNTNDPTRDRKITIDKALKYSGMFKTIK